MFIALNVLVDFFKNLWNPKPVIPKKVKVLFITKSKNIYNTTSPITLSSGLFNSANHIINSLEQENWLDAKLVSVVDNNSIDKEVSIFKPDIVIIEAIWVIPEKFEILKKLHPSVNWIIRIHSEIPFIASEGVALDWITKYTPQPNVYIASNTLPMLSDLTTINPKYTNKLLYLPNIYPCYRQPLVKKKPKTTIKIGCFGSIRLLKNHLTQAVAAIKYADQNKLSLEFHINSTRIEGYSAENILKNLRALFANRPEHRLVEHNWEDQSDFKQLITELDLGLQVSFSETFNLVAADMITAGIPVIGSSEIYWLSTYAKVNSTAKVDSIVKTIDSVNSNRSISVDISFKNLSEFSTTAKQQWKKTLLSLTETKQ